MKLDRRNFMKFTVGATAGFLLTPVNWKLMDDVAIWTQNWSWVPVPKDGARAYANTACLICGGGCGLKVRLIDGQRAVKIEGNPNNPLNRGGVCAWGAAGLQYQYMEENRVLGPMMRDPGISAWRKISWDRGLKMLTAKLKELKGRPGEVVILNGRKRSSMNVLLMQLAAALGTPNYLEIPDSGDVQRLVAEKAFGQAVRYGFDVERAECILSFGAALIEGWGAPVRMQRAFEIWRGDPGKGRAKIIQVEARASMTASKADLMLAPKPGSETALALGIAQVMVAGGMVDPAAASAPGFGGFKAMLADYTPEAVAELTGVEAGAITKAAKMFAKARRAVALSALGQGSRPEPYSLAWAAMALNALKGNLGRPGGVYVTEDLPYPRLPELGATGGRRADDEEHGPVNLKALAENVIKGKAKVSALIVFEANPLFTGPNPEEIREMLEAIPFKVSFSPFLDETTNACDLILPNHAPLERWDDIETPLGVPYQTLSVAKPLFGPKYDTRPTGDLVLGLAAALGADLGYESYEAFIKARLELVEGLGYGRTGAEAPPAGDKLMAAGRGGGGSADEIAETGVWYAAGASPSAGFSFDELPEAGELTPAGGEDKFPLTLVAFESFRVASGFYANPPFVTKLLDDDFLLKKDVFVNLNPTTAEEFGLREGDPAYIETPSGSARVRVHLTQGAMPDVVFLPLGLGHTSFDGTIRGKGVNGAKMVPAIEDPASGLPLTYIARVNLVKA